MTLDEFHKVAEIIQEKMVGDVEIITGVVIRDDLGEGLQVTAIGTGVGNTD
jgi:cell division GTPase FtsZ